MPRITYTLHLVLVLALLTATACKNKNTHVDLPASVIASNPAYQMLNDSIHRFPLDASLYLRRARRLTLENQHDLAYTDFLQAWTIQPILENGKPFAVNLGILGKQQERLALLESLNAKYPDNNQIGRLLADAFAAGGKTNQALVLYDKMIAKDSLDAETLYEKGILLQALRDTVRAIAALQKAYSIQGVDTYGLELANLYAEQKNPRAMELCNYIIKHDSARVLIDPMFIKGIYYSNIKQYAKAIEQFDLCILRDWKTTDAYLEKGRAYFEMGNMNAAMQTFNMAITVSNTDPDAYFWLARCFEAKQMKMDAINNYRKAISLDKNFTEARVRMDSLDRGFDHSSH